MGIEPTTCSLGSYRSATELRPRRVGEYRSHAPASSPLIAVLEVRSHEVPFILEDGQIIGRLVYEPLTEAPTHVYGQGIGSNYQRQGLKLSKHFRPFDPAQR